MDYQIRPDGIQKIFLSEKDIDVADTLQRYYDYIYESICREGFILKYDKCNLFKELVFDGKVVGFCSYDHSREFITASLNNIYILPEFRGKGIFLNELKKTMEEHNKPSIMEPTRLIVEILIKYGFAAKVDDNIVASAIEFVIPGDHVLSNAHYENEELSTHFYDLSICASIHILDVNKAHVAYSAPLNYDIINYDCLEYRNKIDEDYFIAITDLFLENDVKLMNVLLNLEEALPLKSYSLEDVIGGEDYLSPYIESLIDDAHVTYQKALKIKQQIREEYEAGMILNESLLVRLAYLFNENPQPTITAHDDVCPYCSMPIDNHDRFCHYCGVNLEFDADEVENNLVGSIAPSDAELTEDIRFIAFKFLSLIDEKIETEYSIWTVENTYGIRWDVLKSFLDKNNYFRDGSITEEGYGFINSHPLHFWQKYHMDAVDYTDFENYFYNHACSNPKDTCLKYLNQLDDDEYIQDIIDEIKKDR